jgi:hypothetical protein
MITATRSGPTSVDLPGTWCGIKAATGAATFSRGTARTRYRATTEKYQTWPKPEIFQTVSEELSRGDRPALLPLFYHSWSHYVRLLSVEKCQARTFYKAEDRTTLPGEALLADELKRTRKVLENRITSRKKK